MTIARALCVVADIEQSVSNVNEISEKIIAKLPMRGTYKKQEYLITEPMITKVIDERDQGSDVDDISFEDNDDVIALMYPCLVETYGFCGHCSHYSKVFCVQGLVNEVNVSVIDLIDCPGSMKANLAEFGYLKEVKGKQRFYNSCSSCGAVISDHDLHHAGDAFSPLDESDIDSETRVYQLYDDDIQGAEPHFFVGSLGSHDIQISEVIPKQALTIE